MLSSFHLLETILEQVGVPRAGARRRAESMAGGVVRHLEERVRVLRATPATLLQTAAAAAIAWLIARDVLDHHNAFFAPIAAVIVLGVAPGRRTRRAVEIVLGVGVGIAVGDLLIAAIGRGAAQLGFVVLLAMAGSILLGGSALVTSQAAASAVLVATVPGSSTQTRFVDALVGGAAGLAVLAVAPLNPARLVRRELAPVFAELTGALDDVAAALEARDLDAARTALARARGTDGVLASLQNAVVMAEETVRLAPSQWHERARIERFARAARHLGFAMRNTRVIARAAVRAVELVPEIPPELVASLRSLRAAVAALERALDDEPGATADVLARVEQAAVAATAALDRGGGFAVDALVGQVRSTATDVLSAAGLEPQAAVDTSARRSPAAEPGYDRDMRKVGVVAAAVRRSPSSPAARRPRAPRWSSRSPTPRSPSAPRRSASARYLRRPQPRARRRATSGSTARRPQDPAREVGDAEGAFTRSASSAPTRRRAATRRARPACCSGSTHRVEQRRHQHGHRHARRAPGPALAAVRAVRTATFVVTNSGTTATAS